MIVASTHGVKRMIESIATSEGLKYF
eukprot:SAG22_NODE_13300_length_411_cov_0.881410_1_plen_25_part_10